MLEKIKQLIRDGEGVTVEFKRCTRKILTPVYNAVSAFSNCRGGYIFFGVEDNGEISGINKNVKLEIKRNFINSLNCPQRFSPTLLISLEEAEIDGKIVLWCYIPPSSQVITFSGKVFYRAADSNIDITRNYALMTQLYQRKSMVYSERKIFPFAKESDFNFTRLMPIVRQLAKNHFNDEHPWLNMTDMEIMRSAGLYTDDRVTGETGFNLAAILLFGRDEVIQSCTPNYVTDAICRNRKGNRNERLLVKTNLIDAYTLLINFIEKHTDGRIFKVDGEPVMVRSKIARELVSNILIHREYTNVFPAKLIIESDRIFTENNCNPKFNGRIEPDAFAPYPKNPLLASFFINIGRADILGSGVRNLYKYSKAYSEIKPEIVDGDVFRTTVPLYLPRAKMNYNTNVSVKPVDEPKTSDKKPNDILTAYLKSNDEITSAEAAKIIGRSLTTARRLLTKLVDDGTIVATGGNRNRKYKAVRTVEKQVKQK
ncbi:ATP-dependent DNA helicase RecG [Clostridia bacterium]|nr:ATP-dependent DNA helicase RecG [Clostridia bacterium]